MHAFVVNLASRADRLHACKRRFEQFPLEIHRVDAVDASTCKTELEAAHPLLSAPVAACWLSHQAAYRAILESDLDFALVLEDDAVPAHGLSRVLSGVQQVPHAVKGVLQIGFLDGNLVDRTARAYSDLRAIAITEMFRALRPLGTVQAKVGPRLRVREVLQYRDFARLGIRVAPASFTGGAHAYIVSRAAAAALLGVNKPAFLAADDLLSALAKMRTVPIGRLVRSVVGQAADAGSDIGRARFVALEE